MLRAEGYFGRREVQDLVLALEAVRDPRDDRALFGFLRSPFVGLRDETLLQLARRGDPPRWNLLADAPTGEAELLARGVALIEQHASLRDRVPIHELLESLLDRSGYLAHLVLLGAPGAQAVANVRKFVRLARQHAGSGVGDFLRMIRDIRERGDREGDERLYGPQDDVMTLTTVHSAKGLEWHTVFWCDLDRKPGGGGWGADALLVGRDRVALKDPDAEKDEQPAEWTELKAVEDAESAAEQKRLWYVAATRAKQRLILSGVAEGSKNKAAPGQALLGGLGLPVREGAELAYPGNEGATYSATVSLARPVPPAPAVELPDPWTVALPGVLPAQFEPLAVPAGPARHSATSLMMHQRCARRHWLRYVMGLQEPEVERAGPGFVSALARGQIVHDVLEHRREELSLEASLEEALDERGDEVPSADTDIGREVRQKLLEEIRLVADQPEYRALASNPTSRRELGFLNVVDAGAHLEGKFDLAALEDAGIVLLDVKTAQGDAAHAAEVARHYDIQRSVYVRAAEAIGGLPVSRFAFQFSRAGVQLSTPMDGPARESARREVEEQFAAIGRGEAPLTAFPKECRYCGFKAAGWCPGVDGGAD